MTNALTTETIEELWQSFATAGPQGRDEITLEGLRKSWSPCAISLQMRSCATS